MSGAGGDLRYALRSMRGSPGFTAVAVASLALGIGVNTAIFSLVDQLLLWSVPAREPAQLVNVEGGLCGTYPFYCEYRDRNQVFSGMLASSRPLTVGLRPEGARAVEVGHVSYVSGNYFQTLGAGAAAGRVLVDSDDRKPGGSQVAVLSYGGWQRWFAGNLNAIGRKVEVSGYPLEIVGIAERGFGGVFNGQSADVFVPVTMYPLVAPHSAPVWNTPNMDWLSVMGRLKPGVSIEAAQAGLRVLWPQAVEAVNGAGKPRKFDHEDPIAVTAGAHGVSSGSRRTMDPLEALLIATGLVLLIASANVANLLLARAAGRRKEIAVRMALGATRVRLVRQLLTESLVLAAMGGVAGLALAYGSVAAIATANLVGSDLRFRPSVTVAAFSVAITVLTAVLFGLAPALRATRMDPGGARIRLGKLGIPILLGREFEPRDEPVATPRDSLMAALGRMAGNADDAHTPGGAQVCIINESLARRLFGGSSAVGRHLSFDSPYSAESALEIVGVVKDVHHSTVRRADSFGTIYVPSWRNGAEARYLAVRTSGSTAPVVAAIRSELRALDPNVPLLGAQELEDDVSANFRRERMIAYLCGCFGALALVLASVGLYGVTAYAVAQRTKEVGIRMALGAQRLDVVSMIVRESLVPVLAGVVIGAGAALAATRLVASLLFGVAPRDPVSFFVATLAILAVALAASAVPARRASRVEPLVALRYE